MNRNLTHIHTLLAEVECFYGRVIRTTVHFEALSVTIENGTNERISASTLKRLWGYVNDRHEPRQYTLDVLSKYIGQKDFKHFCQKIEENPENTSAFFTPKTIASSQLAVGDKLEIGWTPDRYLVLLYLGDNDFRVLVSENSKLEVNDEFLAANFMLGYPLYLSSVLRNTQTLPAFVAGSQGGLTVLNQL